MSSLTFVLPGDEVPPSSLPVPSNSKQSLKLGPGLRHEKASNKVLSTVAGLLCVDAKKHAVWVESSAGRYDPSTGDLVIAQIQRSSGDNYLCTLSSHTTFAILPQLSFPLATRKSRPQLNTGAIVYARVASSDKFLDPELECVNPNTNKADGLGELKGGMIFRVSTLFARRLMIAGDKGGIVVLKELADKLAFEIAVGRNGKVWIDSKSRLTTLNIGKALEKTDLEQLGREDQRKLARKLLA